MLTPYPVLDIFILVTVFVYVLHKYVSRNFDHWRKKKVFYFEPLPFVGNFLDILLFKTTIGEFLKTLYDRTDEPFFGIFIFGTPHLVVKSPEVIKSMLVKDFNNFDDRTITSSHHDPILSSALFFAKNPEWKTVRTNMTPVYTTGKLKAMIPLINVVGGNMTEFIAKKVAQPSLEVKEICARYTTDVIASCAFAINAHCFDQDGDSEFRAMGRLVFDFRLATAVSQTSYFFLPGLVELFGLKFMDDRVAQFMKRVFLDAVAQRESSGEKRNDVIDAIVQMKKRGDFSDEHKVVAQAVQFFLAGFETNSSTIAFSLYELCLHPQIQTKLRAEIKSCLQEHGGFTYEAVQSMKYLHMCVSETLRKYPPLPFLDRRCKADYKISGSDVTVKKGTPVYIPMFGLHYDERYFPEPQKYDPDRFSESRIDQITPFSYMPFGEGPRNCIGARFGLVTSKLGLIHILSEFEVERSSDTPVPLKFEPRSVVLASKVGLPMKFRKCPTSAG